MSGAGTTQGATAPATARFPDDRRRAYLRRGRRRVKGYLDSFGARVLDLLLQHQAGSGITGSLGEIGVHHGQLFLIALLNSRSNERTFAVDIFERQDLNLDRRSAGWDLRGSARGDETIFRQNLLKHAGATDAVEVFSQSSLDLDAAEILERCGSARFVSVDGGHTEECALNDLELAERVLVPGGLVVMDDFFNPAWPGVTTGIASYALNSGGRLQPFLVTPNKLYLTEADAAAGYLAAMRERLGAYRDNESELFGSTVQLYGTMHGSSPVYYRSRSFVKSHPGLEGRIARALKLPSTRPD